MSTALAPWSVAGSYFEACNCEAVCPCRREGGRAGGRSTHGVCDFALSWSIAEGAAAGIDLGGRAVVLAGSYSDDEDGAPWRVALYVDERADEPQHEALAAIFLGRAGGETLRNYARAIGEVHAVRRARIELDHRPGRRLIRAGSWVRVNGDEPVEADGPVSCGIPGHDHPGTELRTAEMAVAEPPLRWHVTGRCGFATDFSYRSD